MRRIIGQCSIADFRLIERLTGIASTGQQLDLQLTRSQSIALGIVRHFREHNLSFDVCLKLKEVLVWKDDRSPEGEVQFEFKLLDPHDRETRVLIQAALRSRDPYGQDSENPSENPSQTRQ